MKLDSNITAVVTGGASGLGEATAGALAAEGVKVGIFDLNEERGTAVARDIGSTSPPTRTSTPASPRSARRSGKSGS